MPSAKTKPGPAFFINPPSQHQKGFTLVELAIVLIIFALLVGGMLMSLSTQQDISNTKESEKRVTEIRDALLGYAATYGRLPCPAIAGATGIESPVGGGNCTTVNYDGFLPAITLGIANTNAQGYALDSWGNPIRYAVTHSNANAFTTTGSLKTIWAFDPSTIAPDLRVCNTSAGIAGVGVNAACAAGSDLTNVAVAVILSAGKNGGVAPIGADELANSGANRTFISHTQSPTGAAQGEFDDVITWISPNILFNRMISAGRLP
jgi:prepilin-type N-terminal cleavage/methylation domain-containing protein